MNCKQPFYSCVAFTILLLTTAVVDAQPTLHARFQAPRKVSKAAPEQLYQMQSHLQIPTDRIQYRGELGLVGDDIMTLYTDPNPQPRRALLAKLPVASREDEDGRKREGRANKELVELLRKAVHELEKKIESTDSKKERAVMKERLDLVVQKLRAVQGERKGREEDREHRDDRHSDVDDHDHGDHDHEDDVHGDHHEPHYVELEKIRALHEAAERLEHGGLHEMAHQLHRQAEEIEKAIDREHGEGPERMLREILENMDQLRREVREVNERLDIIMKRLDRK